MIPIGERCGIYGTIAAEFPSVALLWSLFLKLSRVHLAFHFLYFNSQVITLHSLYIFIIKKGGVSKLIRICLFGYQNEKKDGGGEDFFRFRYEGKSHYDERV